MKFFKDCWEELRTGNPGAVMGLIILVGVIVAIIVSVFGPKSKCYQYSIYYDGYRFYVDNYSQDSNSITFKDGSANVTLVGNYEIREYNCSR